MLWIFFAMIAGLGTAAQAEVNRQFKINGLVLTFGRFMMATLLLLPFVMGLKWPEPSLFYAAAAMSGAISVFGKVVQFNLAAQHNGRVSTLFMPLQAFTVFFLWMMVDSTVAEAYAAAPLRLAGVLMCFSVVAACMFAIRRNDIGWKAFVMVAPVGILYACMDVITKSILDEQSTTVIGIALIYVFIASMSGLLVSSGFLARQSNVLKKITNKKVLKASVIVAAMYITAYVAFIMAIMRVTNPAYVNALMMLTPAWLLAYNKLRNVPDDANPVAGTVMVAAAVALILITI